MVGIGASAVASAENDVWIAIGAAGEVARGQSKAVHVRGLSVLVCHAAGGIYAIANQCTHAAMPLEGGRIRGNHLTCPVHGARFDLQTGAASGLTKVPVRTFDTRVQGGQIYIRV